MVAERIEIVSQSDVRKVAFADEGQVIGGCAYGDIRRWNIEDGQQRGPTMQASRRILSVVVSPDARWVVSGDWNKLIVWSAATHEKVHEFIERGEHVWGIDISSDSTKIASADGDAVRIFSITGIRLLPPIPHHWVEGVKFSPDGRRLATASVDSGFRVYSTHNGDILFDAGLQGSSIVELSDSGNRLVWSSDGQKLFVANPGKIICLDLSKSSSSEWLIHQTHPRVSMVSNGKFIACSAGSLVSFWNCVSHKQIGSVISRTAEIYCTALSPSGRYLACGVGRNITIHNLRDALPPEYFDHGSRALCDVVSRLPLLQVSGEVLKSWRQGDPTNTETLLSGEIMSTSIPSHYALANRALIRVHLKLVELAIEDAKESLQIQPSPIGYIAMAVALLGQGDGKGALCTFDLAFHDCEPHDIRLLLLLKSILVFESGDQEEAITRVEQLATRASNDDDSKAPYLYTQVLGVMYTEKGDYGRAIPLIEHAKKLYPKDKQCSPIETISLIFGWNVSGLDIVAQQHLCETFYAEKRAAEAVEVFLNIIRTSDKIQLNNATADWIADFTKKCTAMLEHVGDEACEFAKYSNSTMLSLSPPSPAGLLVRRSASRAAKELWADALRDASDAVKVDPSYPWGYEAQHVAFHGAKRYDEAIDAFKLMLHTIEQSHDPAIRQLRNNYISPSETAAAIDHVIHRVLKNCPLVVIHITTGCLCDGPERMRIFKADSTFKELVSSMTRELDNDRIHQVVATFFGYVMFSHAWQGNEPSFQDVNTVKSVWKLPDTPLSKKLRNFCKETRRLGYNWAWSDTCCIDKATSSILNQSLTSMYKWYADSEATIVFLAGVAHPSKLGDLARSFWMTRAWTLQELLAPKVVFFYDSEWKPYLGDTSANHKESPEIMQELADAIKIPRGTIVMFSPNDLGVREKLRLASTRSVTVEEDVAYSLIGIFKSDIRPHYGEGADALGHLLEEIVARTGDVTVLGWSGKSSSYNSCLPASIVIYSQTPHNPPSLEGEEMNTCVAKLHGELPKQDALSIFKRINSLPAARFAARRLHLPCIIFPVRGLVTQEPHRGNEKLYRAEVSGLGNVEFMTADDLPLQKRQKLVFVHPWISHIRGPSSWVTWEDDSESDTESDPVLGSNSGSGAPRVERYAQALQMIARLGQPFNALLLVQQPNREYKRVAAENEIVVSGLGTNITSKNIRAQVLEIL